MTDLFTPLQAGDLALPNRILMAPLTRCRAEDGHVPGELMATHYAQRASAGLLIAEATMAMPGQGAFGNEPGIHSDAQVAGWKQVTDAVHAAGGRIVLQIWHGGRACHPYYNDGAQPVGPSPIAITNNEVRTADGKQPYVTPRELRDDEIPAIVAGFGKAAAIARATAAHLDIYARFQKLSGRRKEARAAPVAGRCPSSAKNLQKASNPSGREIRK